MQVQNLCQEDLLEEETAAHSSILAEKFPWTEEQGAAKFYKMMSAEGEGNSSPLQYSCLENPMDRGAWQAAVQGFAKSHT